MKKNMYSLMLAEDVVREIDVLAQTENTNRSNLINQILAEYVSLVTPEKRIDAVFRKIEDLMSRDCFEMFFEPHDNTMSIKSFLEYRYRPTLRYEVEMYHAYDYTVGELKVNFRTQSPELLEELTRFFGLWTRLEELYLSDLFPSGAIRYALEEGKFRRSFAIPKARTYDSEQTGEAICNYIETFDELLKGWLKNQYPNSKELENAYLARLEAGMLAI